MKILLLIIISFLIVLWSAPLSAQESDYEVITPENAAQLERIATYGRGTVGSVARWSPDGDTLAVTGTPGVWLFDAGDLNVEPELIDAGDIITDVEWSPDGNNIAFSGHNSVYLWNFEGKTLTQLDGSGPLAFTPDSTGLAYVRTTDISPDDVPEGVWHTRLAVDVHVWDIDEVKEVQVYEVPDTNDISGLDDLDYSPDGETLYLLWGFTYGADCGHGGTNNGVFAFEGQQTTPVAPDELLKQFDENELYLSELAFSADGTLAVARQQFDTIVWNTSSQQRLLTIEGSGKSGNPISKDGSRIAVSGRSGTQIFEIPSAPVNETPQALATILFNGTLDFKPDGLRLAINHAVWDAENGDLIDAALVDQFYYSNSADYLLRITPDNQVYTLYPATGDVIARFEINSAWGQYIVLSEESVLIIDRDRTARLFSATTGELLADRTLSSVYPIMNADRSLFYVPEEGDGEDQQRAAVLDTRTGESVNPPDFREAVPPYFSSDNVLAYRSTDDELRFWDFDTQTLLPFSFPDSEGLGVEFVENARFIVVLDGHARTATIWDTQTDTLLPEIPNVLNINDLELDGDRMLTAAFNSETKMISVHDLETGDEISRYQADGIDFIDDLEFRGDIVTMRYCSLEIHWNYVTGELVEEEDLPALPTSRSYLARTPDDWIGVLANEGQITLWNTEDDTELASIDTGEGQIRDLQFTTDGRFLIGRDPAQRIVVWGVPE
jgi:WD40 repeat protein